MLAQNTFLGVLSYYEVYDDFDGPKCFSVINNLKQLYLVYWAGSVADGKIDTWLYTNVSEKKLDKVRRQEESVQSAFKEPELNVYFVTTDYVTGESELELVQRNRLLDYNLPPPDFEFEPDEIEVVNQENDWQFELNIQRRSDKHAFPDRKMVTRVIDAFSEIIESLMLDGSRRIPKVYPKSAVPGSFEVKLATSDEQRASEAITAFNKLLKDVENLDENLIASSLDPYRVKELLEIIEQHRLTVTISPRTYQLLCESIKLDTRQFEVLIEKLNNSTAVLVDSIAVPQANNIERVIDIVQRRARGEKLNHELIDGISSQRQVKYHTDAAYCLGLMKRNLSLTSAGMFLASKEDRASQFEFLADRFESSEFGWGWIKWSAVNNMVELDPLTAPDFISQCVSGLNEETAGRRATTLTKWLKVLKPYRREYSNQKAEEAPED